ncbi:MAG: glycosyltransferase family 4 protein [Candidatus Dormibacteria bacterium]
MSRVLILGHERLSEQMSGTSIRNWEVARALAGTNDVTVAAPGQVTRSHPQFTVTSYTRDSLPALVDAHDVAMCSGFVLHENPCLLDAEHLVIDLYGPFQLESLHQFEDRTQEDRLAMGRSFREVVAQLVRCGDLFLCASERQRDFWLGWLDVVGRINVVTHEVDPGYSDLLRVVPFGLPDEPPSPSTPLFRGVVPGIDRDSYVVLWGGGIWNWFDPLTLIRAAALTRDSLPQLRVVFPAAGSPSEKVPAMAMSATARALSDELGLTGNRVFFGKGWVPYERRGSLFLEADVGVSLHREDIETRFSFRTRVLDYLWTGLPIITTEGDAMADLVGRHDLGAEVRYGDVEGVATALIALSDPARRRECQERTVAVADEFRWSKVASPLIDFCARPHQAPDRALARSRQPAPRAIDPTLRGPAELARLARRTAETIRRTGWDGVAAKVREYVRRRTAGLPGIR